MIGVNKMLYAFFSGALFSCVLFSSALFSGHQIDYTALISDTGEKLQHEYFKKMRGTEPGIVCKKYKLCVNTS